MAWTNQSARHRVKAPAVGLVIVGSLSGAFSVWGLMYLLKIRDEVQTNVRFAGMAKNAPMLVLIGYTAAVVGIVISFLVIFGGIQMFRVRNYGWAVTASVLSCVAALFTAWPLIPIGVWALVVLIQPAVKDEFARPVT